MNYLITGHKGFIGTNLTNYLRAKRHNFVGLDYYNYDLCNQLPNLPANCKIDAIVHLAAETNVRESIQCPEKTFLRNCQSTLNALEIARSRHIKFIFTSSCGAPNSASPYSASKLACEALCQSYRQSYSMDISILRLSNVYGPYSSHKESVIAKFIKQKLADEPVTIYGSGNQTRDFVYVSDVCKAIYNTNGDSEVSTGHAVSINTLTKMLDIKSVKHSNSISGEITNVSSKNWPGCEVDLEEGLNLTLKWFKDN